VHRIAEVQLRGRTGPLATRVHWPVPARLTSPLALLVLLPGRAARADALARGLCARLGAVVLSAAHRPPARGADAPALEDAVTATHWAADHAAELGTNPGRIVVTGEAGGARLAAAVASLARVNEWPTIARQVLIRPELDGGPAAPPPGRVAPATVVTVDRGPHRDGGRACAAWLRDAGVDVEELRYADPPPDDRMLGDLAVSLHPALEARPARPGPHWSAPR
jgi:acetyl esterase/lipase